MGEHHRRLTSARNAVIDAAVEFIELRQAYIQTYDATIASIRLRDANNAAGRLNKAVDALRQIQDEPTRGRPASRSGTSEQAAKLAGEGTWRGHVQRLVFQQGRVRDGANGLGGGATCDELERLIPNARDRHSSISSAVNWAEQHGWIRDSGHVRETRAGREAIVFEPTDKLIDLVKEERRIA